jgi:hypothetical protein
MSAMDRRRFLVDAGLLASVAACGIWESDSRTAVGELDADIEAALAAMRAIA